MDRWSLLMDQRCVQLPISMPDPCQWCRGCFPEMIPQEVEASWATFLPVRKFFIMNCKFGDAWCSTVLRKEKEAFSSNELVSESALASLMASLLNQFGQSQHRQTSFLVLSFVVTNFVRQKFVLFCFFSLCLIILTTKLYTFGRS